MRAAEMSKNAYMGKVTVHTVTFHICWFNNGRKSDLHWSLH